MQASPQTSLRISDLFPVFIQERKVLKNVSPKTIIGYQCAYKAFESSLDPLTVADDLRGAVKAGIDSLHSRLSPISINDYLRCLNAFFNWMQTEGYLKDRLKIGKLTEPETLPKILPEQEIDKVLLYKPQRMTERTIHLMALCILDVGPRINELLHLRKDQIDFSQSTLFIARGKGRKQRQVPISQPLR